MSESSAQLLSREFESRGVDPSELHDGHLDGFYRSLKPTAASASWNWQPLQLSPSNKVVDCDVMAVIVETRPHPRLEAVVLQMARRLGIGIQLFHAPANQRFIESSAIRPLLDSNQVLLNQLGVSQLSRQSYNQLLLQASFWQAIAGRKKVLFFQTDALLCEKSPYRLEDFTQFDYIGSNWPMNRPIGALLRGGSGGFSLRDWSACVACLQRFPAERWPGGEDGYFAFHLDLMGQRVADISDCDRFSTQSSFRDRSFATHQPGLLPAAEQQAFLQYCPDALSLIAG